MASPCKILIGPLFNNLSILGDYQGDPNVLTFTHLPSDLPSDQFDIAFSYPLDFSAILAQLPPGWEPDLVVWWDLIYRPIPPGIADCPYPTAVFVGDWNLGFLNTLSYTSAFDFVLGDLPLVKKLQALGRDNCAWWPAYSFDPAVHRYVPTIERVYDITFIGNLDQRIQRARGSYLQRLARLGSRYRVCIMGGLFGEAYTTLMNQSKIVFNHSIRQEMNMRAYEAPACGALLFMEDSNLEVRQFLTDRQECVLYNDANLEELLDYYLAHDSERQRIAEAGHRKIQAFSYTHHFKRLLELVPVIRQHFRGPRQRHFHALDEVSRRLLVAGQLYHAQTAPTRRAGMSYLADPTFFQGAPARLAENDPRLLNALGTFLLDSQLDFVDSEHSQERDQASQGLGFARQLFEAWQGQEPANPIAPYHLALVCEARQSPEAALAHYQRSLALLDQQPALPLALQRFVLPFGFQHRFPIEWERCAYVHWDNPPARAAAWAQLLRWQIGCRVAWLNQHLGRLEAAEYAYAQALELRPDLGEVAYELGQIRLQLGQRAAAAAAFRQAAETQPFMVEAWLALCEQQLCLERYAALEETARDFLGRLPISNPFFEAEKQQLRFYLQLARLLGHKDVSGLAPGFFQQLKALGQPEWPGYQALAEPLTIDWQPLLPEEFPPLPPDSGFKPARGSGRICIGGQASPGGARTWQRVYDRSTSWPDRCLGPDRLPFAFPQAATLPRLELEGLGAFNFLLLTPHLAGPCTLAALQAFIAFCANVPGAACLLWTPLEEPGEAELEALGTALGDQDVPITLLSEPLAVDEQIALLQSVDATLAVPAPWTPYYLWWSLALGTPIGYPDPLPSFYPSLPSGDLAPFHVPDWPTAFSEFYRQAESFKQQAGAIQDKLTDFYAGQAGQMALETFWELKLRTPQSSGTHS